MNQIPATVPEIIDAFGRRRFGEICGFNKYPVQRATDMRRRNSISSDHWKKIADAAKNDGLPITLETLERAQRAGREPSAAASSAPEDGHATGGIR